MASIHQLSEALTLSDGDLLALYGASADTAEKAALSELVALLDSALVKPNNSPVEQKVSVSGTAQTVTVQDTGEWVWLFVTMDAAQAALTLTFPATPVDQQEVWFRIDQAIATLTMNANGHTILDALTSITSSGKALVYRYKYDAITDSWYKVL